LWRSAQRASCCAAISIYRIVPSGARRGARAQKNRLQRLVLSQRRAICNLRAKTRTTQVEKSGRSAA
jgi:hypothetical protein